MAAKRAERLVNLVIALLSTRQFVTAAKIRATVPGYDADDRSEKADEAFKRMFERDKAELREMGVPLETGRTSAFDTEDGYRIARADYDIRTDGSFADTDTQVDACYRWLMSLSPPL